MSVHAVGYVVATHTHTHAHARTHTRTHAHTQASKIFSPANLRACQEDAGYDKLVSDADTHSDTYCDTDRDTHTDSDTGYTCTDADTDADTDSGRYRFWLEVGMACSEGCTWRTKDTADRIHIECTCFHVPLDYRPACCLCFDVSRV